MEYGRFIKEAREIIGISKTELSELTGKSRTYIHNIETNQVSLGIKNAKFILSKMGFTLTQLIELKKIDENEE